MTKLQKGQLTPIFRKHLQPRLASCSFSIFYVEGYGKKEKTLDLITKNRSAFVIWTKGLEALIDFHTKVNRRVRGMGDPNSGPLVEPTRLVVNVAKRNVASIEKRLSMQPEPPRKSVTKKLDDAKSALHSVRKDALDPRFDRVNEIQAVRERITELDLDLMKVETAFHEKKLGVTQHDIWRTNVEIKTVRNKVNALAKTHEIKLSSKSALAKMKSLL